MKSLWVIARRELASYFDSLTAYVLIVIFLALSGFFTWVSDSNIFASQQADLQLFFNLSRWTLFFFIPAITMRAVAEEWKSGTIELLGTKAVTDTEIILGKFLAALLLVAVALACTLPYYFTVSFLAANTVDHGAIICGYIGLLLMSASYISIGILGSSLTPNQVVAFLLSLSVSVFFQWLFEIFGASLTGLPGYVFNYLSLGAHFESISRGVLDTRDLLYFGSVIFLGLLLSQVVLSRRHWR